MAAVPTGATPSHDSSNIVTNSDNHASKSESSNGTKRGPILPAAALLFLAMALPMLAAFLAAHGWMPLRTTTIGVDLGTTYSVVAFKDPNTKRIAMVPAKSSKPVKGELDEASAVISETKVFLTPSVVAFLENGTVRAGRDALPYLHTTPQNTVYNAKRFIGRSLADVLTDTTMTSMPHQFGPIAGTNAEGEDIVDAGFVIKLEGHEEVVSPIDVAVHVIESLKESVDSFLGHQVARKAVIAAPAEFTTEQRVQTAAAFERAGFKVVAMLAEPTAAALAYGLHKQPHVHYVLVYDFGGGTLDTSLLWNYHGSMDVVASDGDSELGGSDFDACIFKLIKEKFEPLTEKEASICLDSQLREHAERAKRLLSYNTNVELECAGQRANISRIEFEQGCEALFDRALAPVHRLLSESNVKASEIDEVVLVGGSTRMPRVREKLRDHFGGREPKTNIDPDLAVAYGCASLD